MMKNLKVYILLIFKFFIKNIKKHKMITTKGFKYFSSIFSLSMYNISLNKL